MPATGAPAREVVFVEAVNIFVPDFVPLARDAAAMIAFIRHRRTNHGRHRNQDRKRTAQHGHRILPRRYARPHRAADFHISAALNASPPGAEAAGNREAEAAD